MEKTAVEQLIETMIRTNLVPKGTHPNNILFEQAKKVEKQQIIEAAMWIPEPFNNIEFIPELAKQYYNENYGKM